MPNAPKIDRAHVISWLSEPRYRKYLEVTRGDDAVALDLYLWNIGLAQAVLKDVSFFEVALRQGDILRLERVRPLAARRRLSRKAPDPQDE